MNIKDAARELEILAAGRPWVITYTLGSYIDPSPQIVGYIEGPGHAEPAQTYQGAIDNAREMLGLIPPAVVVEAELPDDGSEPNVQVAKPIRAVLNEFAEGATI